VAKIRLSIILTLFLTLAIQIPRTTSAYQSALLPPSIVRLPGFNQLMDAVRIGKALYKMDAFEKLSKGDLKKGLASITGSKGLMFDIERIAFKNKGFTRYYMFTIGREVWIMRVCLTAELKFQSEIPKEDMIMEGSIADLKATYQVFGISAIVAGNDMKPRATFHFREAERSS
jgi:hypothetical protein